MELIERTLVLMPDAVARGLVGRLIQRFEDAGLKIIGAYEAARPPLKTQSRKRPSGT